MNILIKCLYQLLLFSLLMVVIQPQTMGQQNSNIFHEYNVDEFTGKVFMSHNTLPNEIEYKEYEDLDSVKVNFNFMRKLDTSIDKNGQLYSYSEVYIVLHGIERDYDLDLSDRNEDGCIDGLGNVFFLADGQRIISSICFSASWNKSITHLLYLSTSDLSKIGLAKEVKLRIQGNVIYIKENGINILNEFTKETKKYF